jgi:hypothetical protein
VWLAWKTEFEQMHPNSFTVQKLNLINPIRRKYKLKTEVASKVSAEKTNAVQASTSSEVPPPTTAPLAKPAVPRPVFKPKPKIN